MSLEQKITDDWKTAMKAGDAKLKTILAFVRSELKNKAIESGNREAGLDDSTVMAQLKKLVKQRQETIALIASNTEAVAEVKSEIEVLERYLPKQMAEEDVRAEVQKILSGLGQLSTKDLGKAMSACMAQLKDKADGKLIQTIVKASLQG